MEFKVFPNFKCLAKENCNFSPFVYFSSVDGLRRSDIQSSTIPLWNYCLFRSQVSFYVRRHKVADIKVQYDCLLNIYLFISSFDVLCS